jgi:putative oxidoreductase
MNARANDWERLVMLYGRLALGSAFLSAVGSRFGVWRGEPGLKHFHAFVRYTAEVNSFMPSAVIPFLAWAATAAELSLGIALIIGFQTKWAALGSALHQARLGTARAVSFGIRSPMDYSVFSASSAALLLAVCQSRAIGRHVAADRVLIDQERS